MDTLAKNLIQMMIIVVIGAAGFLVLGPEGSLTIPKAHNKVSHEMVRILGTDRIVTQIVVEDDKSSFLGGTDRVIAAGTVTMLIGVDVDKAEISVPDTANPTVLVRLPDSEILTTELDEDSIVYFRKATIVQRLTELDDQERQSRIRQKIKVSAAEFVKINGLLPSMAEIEKRVREIWSETGTRTAIEFQSLTN